MVDDRVSKAKHICYRALMQNFSFLKRGVGRKRSFLGDSKEDIILEDSKSAGDVVLQRGCLSAKCLEWSPEGCIYRPREQMQRF